MDEKTLVESQIADSAELIKQLDISNNSPSLVSWYFYDDADEWRLLIAGPTFDSHLPKDELLAYKIIAEAMSIKKLSSISISEVKLVKRDEPLMKTMQLLIKTGKDVIVNANFTNTTINGIFIKKMIILRSS